jgi:gluconolactonase
MRTAPPRPYVFFDGFNSTPRLDHAEGIAVAADGALWCGGEAGQIYRIENGAIEQVATTDGFCLGLAFAGERHLFICDAINRCVFRLDTQTGSLERFAEDAEGKRLVSPNAIATDRAGHVAFTDSGERGHPAPGILRFDSSGAGGLWSDEPLDFANGIALSAADSRLYVVETWSRRISVFGVDGEHLGPRRTFVQFEDVLPDGIALDEHRRLWVACYEPSQVLVVESDGSTTVAAHDPDAHLLCHPTNLAFYDLTLIITNLGRWHLTGLSAGVRGANRGGEAGRA